MFWTTYIIKKSNACSVLSSHRTCVNTKQQRLQIHSIHAHENLIILSMLHSSPTFLKEKIQAFTCQSGDLEIQSTTPEILDRVGHNVSKGNFHSSKLLQKVSIHIQILFNIILLCSQLCYARIAFSSLVMKQLTYLNNFK